MPEEHRFPRLGVSVTVQRAEVPAVAVPVAEVMAARRTLAELLALLQALAGGPEPGLHASALGMARHLAARLDHMGADR